jgi:YegS/Rv2252/BmrU family lipid kinase
MKYLFILNPISGPRKRAKKVVNLINKSMSISDSQYEFAFTSGPGDATRIARQAAAQEIEMVVAAGGDGTVNEVATGLVHSQSCLGVIPMGSGNGVARSLNIPLKMSDSMQFLLNPQIVTIDMGMLNEHYFVGVCGIGYDAKIGKKFQEFGVRGPIPYFMIGAREFIFYKSDSVILRFNNSTKLQDNVLLVAVANTKQYGNGAIIAPKADPVDGLLDVCVITKVSLIKALYITFKLFKGEIDTTSAYQHHRCKSIRIETTASSNIAHTDGEPHYMESNLEIKLLEKALHVCAMIN